MPIDYTKRKPAAPPDAAPVSLSKISLTKDRPTVSLAKATAIMRVNLNWNARPQDSGGLFRKRQSGTDLDLGCLYEYNDGSLGVVQALGNAFEDKHTFGGGPICRLDGDDRTGTATGGENLHIDLRQADCITRILVFAFIYEGVPNWAAADGVVTLFPVGEAPVEVRLDEADGRAPTCAIAMIQNDNGSTTVRREVRYIHGDQQKLDRAYNWGLRWARGSK